MVKILIVDDDTALASTVGSFLSSQGYLVELSASGEDALRLLTTDSYDIVVLDRGLPEMDGKQVCRSHRDAGGQTPMIFLTGRNDIVSIEEVFDAGADDYLTKPFEIRELSARIKGLLKRRSGEYVEAVRIGDLLLVPEKSSLIKGATEMRLRAKEFALLEFLMRHPDRVFSAQQILDAAWTSDGDGTINSVRTWMNLLRNRLAHIGERDLIKTVHRTGYIIETKVKT